MPDSNAPSHEAIAFFESRFGVAGDWLAGIAFVARRDEIWACRSAPPAGLDFDRPSGLRALRRQGAGLKPTSTFLAALGDRITASRIDLDRESLRQLLLGQRLTWPSDLADGPVALCFRGDVLGCGRLGHGRLQALIPTGRRRELLAALDVDPHTRTGNL